MAKEIFSPTPQEAAELREVVRWWRKERKSETIAKKGDRYQKASGIHVAAVPAGGIPPITVIIGGPDRPGEADCDIYKVDSSTSPARLRRLSTMTKTVYNISTTWIESKWVIVYQTAGGQWVTDCPCTEDEWTGTGTSSGTGTPGTGSPGTGTDPTPCGNYTGNIAVVTGLFSTSGGDILAARSLLGFENGKLCDITSAPTITLSGCCGEAVGTGSGTGTTAGGNCPGTCTYQWQDPGGTPQWVLIVDACSGPACECTPPNYNGSYLGEVADGTCGPPA